MNILTQEQFQLTQEHFQHFQEKGWLGPLDIFTSSEVEHVKKCIETNSSIKEVDGQPMMMFYNNILRATSTRDLHLFYKPIFEILTSPKLTHLIAKLSQQPNLLLWYSNVFCKMPGEGSIKWHQVHDSYDVTAHVPAPKPALLYPRNEEALNLTIWIALDDVTTENGCLHFANKSHKKKFELVKVPVSEGISSGLKTHKNSDLWYGQKDYSMVYDFDENEWEVEAVPVKMGQVLVFTEQVMHYSPANNSNQRRLALNGRYIPPSVQVYSHRLQNDFIDENLHNIEKHFCVLVSGSDDYGINVIRDSHDLDNVELEFQTLSNLVRFGHVQRPQGKQNIEFDALYKQAMEGDCLEKEPDPMLKPRKYIEWQAWNQLKGMSCTEAMKKYNQIVAQLPEVAERQELSLEDEIQNWLVAYVAKTLEIEPDAVNNTVPFERYALGSADSTILIGELEDWLERDLSPTLLFSYPTIELLAKHLAV